MMRIKRMSDKNTNRNVKVTNHPVIVSSKDHHVDVNALAQVLDDRLIHDVDAQYQPDFGHYLLLNTNFVTQLNDNVYIVHNLDRQYYSDDGELINEFGMSGYPQSQAKTMLSQLANRFNLEVVDDELRVSDKAKTGLARLLQALIYGFARVEFGNER